MVMAATKTGRGEIVLTGQYTGNPQVQVQRGYQIQLVAEVQVVEEFNNGRQND